VSFLTFGLHIIQLAIFWLDLLSPRRCYSDNDYIVRYQATLGTRRSLGREFLAKEKRKRGKERRREKEEKRGEKRVEVRKRIRVTSVFSQ
jgi:hypothetical protein